MPQCLLGLFGRDIVHHEFFVGFWGGKVLIGKLQIHQRPFSHADKFLIIRIMPLLWPDDHFGFERVAVDVSAYVKGILDFVHPDRAEGSLEQRP